jgi:tetratricopeptide (TPR) repeat protein
MKSSIILGFVVMLLMANVTISASEEKDKLRILVDESRIRSIDEETLEAYVEEAEKIAKELEEQLEQLGLDVVIIITCNEKCSFKNLGEPWGFGITKSAIEKEAKVTIKDSGKLSYTTLQKYDVLVITSFEKKYSSEEVDAIKKFVEKGGGLFFLADNESQYNTIAQAFDVSFFPERAIIADEKAEGFDDDTHVFYVDDIKPHPITKGVKKIALNSGIPIVSYTSGDVLVKTSKNSWIDYEENEIGKKDAGEKEGPFNILLAVDHIGRGRAVFFGGAMSFWNETAIEEDHGNVDLFTNAVKWLGETGGPYKQYKILNNQAQELLQKATSLYATHRFSEAKDKVLDAIDICEESGETYANSEALEGVERAESLLEKCETGIQADEIFEKAEDLFTKREYEKAIEEYEKAIPLYNEIEYTERVDECSTKIDESYQWMELREEASSLLSQAEDAFSKAPSTFDPTGYENALAIYEQAKQKWEEYNDPAYIAACEEKIALCNDNIAHIKRTKMITIIAVVVVVVAVAGVVVTITLRRKKKKQNLEP